MKAFLPFGQALLLVVALLLPPAAGIAAGPPTDYEVQAAQTRLLLKEIQWPSKHSHVTVCVLGESEIMKLASWFNVSPHPSFTTSLAEEKNWKNVAKNCLMVFISDSEESKLPDIMASLKGKPILTVSPIDGFAERGGMIEFTLVDGKVRFIINTKAIAAEGLVVNADILALAHKVVDR